MNKKLLVSLLLCFFVFSNGMIAQDSPKIIKHLVYAETPAGEVGWSYEAADHTVQEELPEDRFLTFHVPASPSSEAIFFEIWSRVGVKWTTWPTRYARQITWFKIISEVIPSGITVEDGFLGVSIDEKNLSGYVDISYKGYSYSGKFKWRRNSIDWFPFRYTDSGDLVPEDLAISIKNKLIDKGFDVEVYKSGWIQGVLSIHQILAVEVTGIARN